MNKLTTPAATTATRFIAWKDGRGCRLFQKVESDTSLLQAAAAADDPAAVKAAGAQLATDAGAAGLASPSVGRYPYKQAMLAYYAAGTAASLGLYADSARGLRLGTRYLAQTATAFKAATP